MALLGAFSERDDITTENHCGIKPCLIPLERALLLTVFGQVVVAPFEF